MTATGKPRETPNFFKGNHTHQTIHFPGHNMNQATHPKREGHSVERTPPPHNASSTRTCRVQYIFEIWWDISLLADRSMVKNHFKNQIILRCRSGVWASPKSNQFVWATHPTCPLSFVHVCPQLFEISWYISVWPELWMVKNDFKIF